MKNLTNVFRPEEMRFREDIADYSKQELLAHLYVANLLGDNGRRINDFTIRDMRIQSGRCVMRCLMKDGGKWSEGDVEGLEIADCNAELMTFGPTDQSNEQVDGTSSQILVSVPIEVLRRIEEYCKFEIELIRRDVFKRTGKAIVGADEDEIKKGIVYEKRARKDHDADEEEYALAA